jgi:Ulp1 family protease
MDIEVTKLLEQTGTVATLNNITITHEDLECLQPGKWLTSDIIDFYGNLIMSAKNRFKVHYFSTLFFTKLAQEGFKSIMRWTRKVFHSLISRFT